MRWRFRPRGKRVLVGLVGIGVIAVLFLVFPWNLMARRHLRAPFPGTVAVAFLGSSGTAITGASGLVGVDPEPNVGLRLTIMPRPAEVIRLLGVTVTSSDGAGHDAGGGRWDTYSESTRALGIIRDGKVVNWGPKRLLHIDIRDPVTLDLYFADGTMTQFWKYFTVRLEAAGGSTYSAVLERRSWRVINAP